MDHLIWAIIGIIIGGILLHLLSHAKAHLAPPSPAPPLPPPSITDEQFAALKARLEAETAEEAPSPAVIPNDGETVEAYHERRTAAGAKYPRGSMPGHFVWSAEHAEFHDPTWVWSADHDRFYPPGYMWASWLARPTFLHPDAFRMSPNSGGPPAGSKDCPVCSGATPKDSETLCARCYE